MELLMILGAVLALFVLYTSQYILILWSFYKKANTLPTAGKCLPIIGHSYHFYAPANLLLRRFKDLMDITGLAYKVWLGPLPVAMLMKPEHLEAICGSTQNISKPLHYKFLEPWLGTGLLTSKGAKWHKHRKMITPTFHFKILDNFIDVFAEKSQILVKKLKEKSAFGSFDIYPNITMCALDIICETAMGVEVNAQDNYQNSKYVTSVCESAEAIFYRIRSPWLYPDFMYNILPAGKKLKENINILHSFTYKVIRERKQLYKQSLNKIVSNEEDIYLGTKKRMAFLDLLLEFSEKGDNLTDEQIREEVDTFMFEGHDTTTAAMGWALQMLGTHPDVQQTAREELDSIFQGSDRAPTMKDLNEMKYLERVIKETLRLYPSVPIIARELIEDVHIDGMTLPKGITVALGIYYTHRIPEHFPDPDTFNPDNFLPERVANRHPYVYVPFSAGPRNCIGQKFALLEEKVVLSSILRNFSLEAVGEPPVGVPELILRPDGGIHLKITPITNCK